MPVKDRGLGIELVTLGDLLGFEPSALALDGITIRPCDSRMRVKRWDDGKVKDQQIGLTSIRFWIVLDCGEIAETRRLPYWTNNWEPRNNRYLPVGVGEDQEIEDVEKEENGIALPGVYSSWNEACEVSSDLCAVCRIHEA
jgi:hypothetical protein